MRHLIVAILLCFSTLGASEVIDAKDLATLKSKEGEFVTVKGRVYRTFKPKSNKVIFINFEKDYKNSFIAVIFSGNFQDFTDIGIDPLTYYDKKLVEIEGFIEIYKGQPEIIVSSPDQIRVR